MNKPRITDDVRLRFRCTSCTFFSPPRNTKSQRRLQRTDSWRSERSAIWSYLYVCDAEECNHEILMPLYEKKKEKLCNFNGEQKEELT